MPTLATLAVVDSARPIPRPRGTTEPVARRIQSLDGLRAISIAVVVLGHASGRPSALAPILATMPTQMGVDVFFVVSGYLITRLLLSEERQRGDISLVEFYIRRVFRIFPALYVYLAVVLLLMALGLARIPPSSLVGALTFTWNYPLGPRGAALLGHCWSLSVEEQFYVFWPCLLVVLGRTRALRSAIALVLAEPVIRVTQYFAFPSTRGFIDSMGHTRIDTILFGCILALLETQPLVSVWLEEHLRGPQAAAAAATLIVGRLMEQRFHGAWSLTVGFTLEGLAIAAILFWSVAAPSSVFGRFLSLPPVIWVGRISYSLYLWQQLLVVSRPGDWSLPLNPFVAVLAAIACAGFSYYVVERPMLRMRDRVISRWRARAACRGPHHEAAEVQSESGR